MTNEELVTLIQSGENVRDNMGLLYEQNRHFIKKNIKRYTDSENDIEDLMQESYFALVEAVDGYNPELGYKFRTFAWYKIRTHIQRYYYSNKPLYIPEYLRMLIWKYKRFCMDYIKINGHEPKNSEIIRALQITPSQLKQIKKYNYPVESLDAYIDEDSENTVIDSLPDPEANTEESVLNSIMLNSIWNQVDTLPNQKRDVITQRYKHGKTQGEVAKTLNCSTSYVSAIEKHSLKELKQNPKTIELANEFDYNCSISYNGSYGRFKNTQQSVVEELVLKRLS